MKESLESKDQENTSNSKNSESSNRPLRYPVEALGPLGEVVKRCHKAIQAPEAICAHSFLGAVALAAQALRDVYIDGRSYPISLSLLSIANSGERKSAVDRVAMKPHYDHQKKQLDLYEESKKDFVRKEFVFKSMREKAVKKGSGSFEEMSRSLEELGEGPTAPACPIYIVEEPSYEGLIKHFQGGSSSVGLFSDEGGRFYCGYGMSDENQLKTAVGLSELWDGKPITRSRAGDGTSIIMGKRLSTHLMVQPVVIRKVMKNSLLSQQGYFARQLMVWPTPRTQTRAYKPVDLSKDSVLLEYNSKITQLLELPRNLGGASKNDLNPHPIELTADAKELWIDFHDKNEEKQLEDGPWEGIRPFASKAPEHVLRIAAVLSLYEDPKKAHIRKEHIQSAIELIEYYLFETVRIERYMAEDEDKSLQDRLLRWFKKEGLNYIYLQKIYQSGPNPLRKASIAKKVIKSMEEQGLLEKVPFGMDIDGARRKEVWKVL